MLLPKNALNATPAIAVMPAGKIAAAAKGTANDAAVPKSPSFASVFLPVSSCLDMLWLTLSLRVFDMPRVKPVL